jgi:hypothetical protein
MVMDGDSATFQQQEHARETGRKCCQYFDFNVQTIKKTSQCRSAVYCDRKCHTKIVCSQRVSLYLLRSFLSATLTLLWLKEGAGYLKHFVKEILTFQ